ncbi:hypothetical protein IFM89_023853, partial [Coptis chinensis]
MVLAPSVGPPGAGAWKEISRYRNSFYAWSYQYERELPLRPVQVKKGSPAKWSLHSAKRQEYQVEQPKQLPFHASRSFSFNSSFSNSVKRPALHPSSVAYHLCLKETLRFLKGFGMDNVVTGVAESDTDTECI